MVVCDVVAVADVVSVEVAVDVPDVVGVDVPDVLVRVLDVSGCSDSDVLVPEVSGCSDSDVRVLVPDVLVRDDSEDFVFDNQMLAEIILRKYVIGEVSCPTRYFAEASSINFRRSCKYGFGAPLTPTFDSYFLPSARPGSATAIGIIAAIATAAAASPARFQFMGNILQIDPSLRTTVRNAASALLAGKLIIAQIRKPTVRPKGPTVRRASRAAKPRSSPHVPARPGAGSH